MPLAKPDVPVKPEKYKNSLYAPVFPCKVN